MKKLFTNFFLIILVKGFISAAPSSSARQINAQGLLIENAKQTELSRNDEISEIHPLDILTLKFK